MEKPVTFKNRKGENLFGMIFYPEVHFFSRKVGIIITVDAIKYRIGTFRLHTMLARWFCSLGYYVMYFDPAGIGDSEGHFEEKYLFEHYRDIQKGKFREDIKGATEYFESQFQIDTIILFGICGGAISMLIAAAKNPRISQLILLGIPVLLDYVGDKVQKFDEASVITSKEQASRILAPFLRKVVDYRVWADLFAFKIDLKRELKVAWKALIVLAAMYMRNIIRRLMGRELTLFNTSVSKHPRYNMLFQESFSRFVSRTGKILFVFGELDFMTWLFKSEFQDIVLVPGNPYEDFYEIKVIKNADHMFSDKDSQIKLKAIIEEWFQNNYRIT